MEKSIILIFGQLDSKQSFRIHLLVFLLITPAIWLVWYLTASTYHWHFWVIAAWTKGLQFHFVRAIVYKSATFEKLKLWISSKKYSVNGPHIN